MALSCCCTVSVTVSVRVSIWTSVWVSVAIMVTYMVSVAVWLRVRVKVGSSSWAWEVTAGLLAGSAVSFSREWWFEAYTVALSPCRLSSSTE